MAIAGEAEARGELVAAGGRIVDPQLGDVGLELLDPVGLSVHGSGSGVEVGGGIVVDGAPR